MGKGLTEFEKWWREDYSKQKFWESKPPSSIAECAWKAALEWIRRELYEVRAHGFEPDLGLSNLLKRELKEKGK